MSFAKSLLARLSEQNMKEIIRGASWALVFRVAGAIILFGFNILIARFLGAQAAGTYYLALTIATVLGTASLLGIDQLSLRHMSAFKAARGTSKIRRLYTHGRHLIIISSLLLAVSLLSFSKFLAVKIFNQPELISSLRIFALSIPALALTTYYGEILRALKKVKESVLVINNLTPFVGAIILLSLRLRFRELTALSAALAHIVGAYITVLSANFMWKKTIKDKETGRLFSTKDLIGSSLPFFWIALLYLILGWVDTFMLGIFSTASSVGIYNVAIRISKLISFILFAVNIIVAPKFSALYSEGKLDELKKSVHGSTLLITLFSVPGVILAIFFPEFIMGLFGHEFTRGANVLTILAVGQFINAITGAIVVLLTMTGFEKQLRNTVAVITAVNIGLNLLLIPRFDMVGAALATTISMVLVNCAAVVVAWRRLGITTIPTPFERRN